MIDENLTFAFYGYHSFDWSDKSHKLIIVICDECGIAKKSDVRNFFRLCHSCQTISEKTKQKMSIKHKKENLSKETIEKMSKSQIGRKHTEETKRKISENNKGKIISKEHKEKLRDFHLGLKLSDETKEKLSKIHKGKKPSKETREKMSIAQRGKKGSGWKGGISNQKYCYKFNEMKKEEIRNKYNNCDFISGLHKDIINKGKKLSVHHIDYNKEQGCNSEWKLIPLSSSHHSRTNNNRWFWNKLFMNVLEIDEWYYD